MPDGKLRITLAGREHVVEAGTTAGQAGEPHAQSGDRDHRQDPRRLPRWRAAHPGQDGQGRPLADDHRRQRHR